LEDGRHKFFKRWDRRSAVVTTFILSTEADFEDAEG
jgi:hypothetical protein